MNICARADTGFRQSAHRYLTYKPVSRLLLPSALLPFQMLSVTVLWPFILHGDRVNVCRQLAPSCYIMKVEQLEVKPMIASLMS